ncbi:hypothetical protein Bbelb_226450 [Branchiostoma belcheri]|nr:hypothetical protein Bbelb_226450 [Branchiostoma belcheri]
MSTDRSAVVSLAEGEKAIIRRTWAVASRDMTGNGANILLKMFEINPETKKVFAKFRDIPDNQLRSTPRFRAHVTRVMASIGTVAMASVVSLVETNTSRTPPAVRSRLEQSRLVFNKVGYYSATCANRMFKTIGGWSGGPDMVGWWFGCGMTSAEHHQPTIREMVPRLSPTHKPVLTPNHGLKLEKVVSALDDQEVLLDLFKDIGKKHHPPRIPEGYFDVIAGAILCMLQRCLGTDYTAEVDAAWTKLYGGLSRHAKDGLKEAAAIKAP